MSFKRLQLTPENSDDSTNVNTISTITRFVKKTLATPYVYSIPLNSICFYRNIEGKTEFGFVEVLSLPQLNHHLTTTDDKEEVLKWRIAGVSLTPPVPPGETASFNRHQVRHMIFAVGGVWEINNIWGARVLGMDHLYISFEVYYPQTNKKASVVFNLSERDSTSVESSKLLNKKFFYPQRKLDEKGPHFYIGICDKGAANAHNTPGVDDQNKLVSSQIQISNLSKITVNLLIV